MFLAAVYSSSTTNSTTIIIAVLPLLQVEASLEAILPEVRRLTDEEGRLRSTVIEKTISCDGVLAVVDVVVVVVVVIVVVVVVLIPATAQGGRTSCVN